MCAEKRRALKEPPQLDDSSGSQDGYRVRSVSNLSKMKEWYSFWTSSSLVIVGNLMKMFRTCALLALSAPLVPCSFGQLGWLGTPQQFTPKNRLSGIGIDREMITDAVLERRTALMIESQTFSIMRDPQALTGAQRMTNPKMKHLFQSAAEKSGMPAEMLTAISYLESWGDPKEERPAGPKGVMQ